MATPKAADPRNHARSSQMHRSLDAAGERASPLLAWQLRSVVLALP